MVNKGEEKRNYTIRAGSRLLLTCRVVC